MSPESIISVLSRLNELLEARHQEHMARVKRFRQLQMMLFVLSLSVAITLFFVYSASVVQMGFILLGFNLLFFIGFKPRSFYNKKNLETLRRRIVSLQDTLKKFLTGEEVSFGTQRCSLDEGWNFDKWGLHKGNRRIDYGEFLYDKEIKGLYLEALRNRR